MRFFACVLLLLVGLIAWRTSLVLNVFSMVEGIDNYFIPAESSIFTFQPTIDNPGSGSWWLFGRDHSRYYALSMTGFHYHHIRRDNACKAFDPHRLETWCGYETSPVPR